MINVNVFSRPRKHEVKQRIAALRRHDCTHVRLPNDVAADVTVFHKSGQPDAKRYQGWIF